MRRREGGAGAWKWVMDHGCSWGLWPYSPLPAAACRCGSISFTSHRVRHGDGVIHTGWRRRLPIAGPAASTRRVHLGLIRRAKRGVGRAAAAHPVPSSDSRRMGWLGCRVQETSGRAAAHHEPSPALPWPPLSTHPVHTSSPHQGCLADEWLGPCVAWSVCGPPWVASLRWRVQFGGRDAPLRRDALPLAPPAPGWGYGGTSG